MRTPVRERLNPTLTFQVLRSWKCESICPTSGASGNVRNEPRGIAFLLFSHAVADRACCS